MSTQLPDDAPATRLFPQFQDEIHRMYSAEVEGLTDAQLDFASDRWEWSKWSIRRNVSHVVSGDYRWFLLRWTEQLFPGGPSDIYNLDQLVHSPYDRRLSEDKYWRMEDILGVMRGSLDLCLSILSRETVASMRTNELKVDDTQWRVFGPAHPTGVRWDPADDSQVYVSLECTFRHRWFEYVTHLYNVQRLKRAQGLTARVDLPREGYWTLPDWDRSEP